MRPPLPPSPALSQTFGSSRATINQEPAWYLWSHAIRYHHTKYHPRALGLGMGERKGNSSTPILWLGPAVSTKTCDPTCDPTKSSDTGRLGIIVVIEYKVGRWKRGRGAMVCGLGRKADLER